MILRQSTAVTVEVGPFLDSTDGSTAETGLTITQSDIRLSKNGGSFAQKSAAGTASHMENGYYSVSLSTTDTNTVGRLRLHVVKAGALPVWMDFQVVEEAVYDALFASGAVGPLLANSTGSGLSAIPWNSAWDAEVQSECADALNAYDPPTNAEMEARTLPAASYATASALQTVDDEIATIDNVVDAIKAVTDNLPDGGALSSLATASALSTVDSVVDAIKVTTDKLDDTLELDGSVYRFTENALEQAPSGGSGATAQEVWEYATRTLTALDEDSTTLDIDTAVRAAVGLSSANLDTQIAALPTAAENADAVWEEALADHSGTAGSAAEQLAAAGAAGDPWATALPGSYTEGQAGKIVSTVGTVVDAIKAVTDNLPDSGALSSLATASALSTVDSVVDAIKAVTDNLPDGGALSSLATAAELAKVPKSDGTATWNATAAAQIQSKVADALTAYDPPTKDELDSGLAGLNIPTAAAIADAVLDEALSGHTTAGSLGKAIADIKSDTAAILEDTGTTIPNTLGTPAGASVSADLADIEGKVDDLESRLTATRAGYLDNLATPPATQAQVASELSDALTVDVIADSVPADGSRPTIAQALYMIVQFLTERAVSGTTMTVKKPDGSTTLMTFTLDDSAHPTSITRTS